MQTTESTTPTYSPAERARLADLTRLLAYMPGRTVLEIGARDGRVTGLLADRYKEGVTALDLTRPSLGLSGVREVVGDVTDLDFPDKSFDCVICTEVLEHVGALEQAAREITRVTRFFALIGVPYRQDTRVGRTRCARCGKTNPPYGHVNTFDERTLDRLFAPMSSMRTSRVWTTRERTNALSAWLMSRAGNPWGTYDQDEPCVHCGAKLVRPASRPVSGRAMTALASGLDHLLTPFRQLRPAWIHVLFRQGG